MIIKINDKFEIKTETNQFVLVEYYVGKDAETKKPKTHYRERYFPTLKSLCLFVLDKIPATLLSSEKQNAIIDLTDAIKQAEYQIIAACKKA